MSPWCVVLVWPVQEDAVAFLVLESHLPALHCSSVGVCWGMAPPHPTPARRFCSCCACGSLPTGNRQPSKACDDGILDNFSASGRGPVHSQGPLQRHRSQQAPLGFAVPQHKTALSSEMCDPLSGFTCPLVRVWAWDQEALRQKVAVAPR